MQKKVITFNLEDAAVGFLRGYFAGKADVDSRDSVKGYKISPGDEHPMLAVVYLDLARKKASFELIRELSVAEPPVPTLAINPDGKFLKSMRWPHLVMMTAPFNQFDLQECLTWLLKNAPKSTESHPGKKYGVA